ncbi:hypothetical protein S40285_10110 [Stachybotrys chlorohalonatus IBT 40285]|uniref:Uncharacterized protein n=1 Tax=Stachybotrys chlorohalonatus (strain IBT 40285) TaxID=1283841 RepID=A0A084QCN7_STAC4|nr:hypothetical protein S40285_10110 [Stachybotrys chlorohalonata IBT 40285]
MTAEERYEVWLLKSNIQTESDVYCEDNNGGTPLNCATQTHAKSTAKVFLDAGANPNAGSGYGKPLLQAVTHEDKQVV